MKDPAKYPNTLIDSKEKLPLLEEAVNKAVRIAVDTETHDALVLQSGIWAALRIIAVAVKYEGDNQYESFVVDARDIDSEDIAPVMAQIQTAHAWNANFDEEVLQLANSNTEAWQDAMFTDGLLHSGSAGFEFWHGLAFAARKYLGLELDGKGTTQTSYDAESDLTPEQISYPGQDAIVTLWVSEVVDDLIVKEGLEIPAAYEHAARPFLLSMMQHGLPFQRDLWHSEVLAEHEEGKKAALLEMANLSGGAEVTLFGESEEPSWNPDSDVQVRDALNQWASDAVKAFTGGRLLDRTDKMDKTTFKQIKHPLAKALLQYRGHSKVLSTYGGNLDKYIDENDHRIRPRYKQGGVVATGRLASDKPNAQNFSPSMKAYIRPFDTFDENNQPIKRVFVYADLSQVDLRVLAVEANDERMKELFRKGGDFHALTAADMFHVDMDALAVSDPEKYSETRKKSKGVNFGMPYGLRAAGLAQNLTINSGLKVTTAEAQEILDAYAKAYVNVDKWLQDRDKYVRELSNTGASQIDWVKSFELLELYSAAKPLVKKLPKTLGRGATREEISQEIISDSQLREELAEKLEREPTEEELATARLEHSEKVRWALTFDTAVAVKPDGTPWTFESRTRTGRRRLFTVPMDTQPKDKFSGILTSAMLIVCTSDKPKVAELREEFAQEHGLKLPEGINRHNRRNGSESSADARERIRKSRNSERMACVNAFGGANRHLKLELLKFVAGRMGWSTVEEHLLPAAFGDQVRSMSNKYRNHPIQSLVADIGLRYYADLHERLKKYRDAYPVQAVHDSITIECDLQEAVALKKEVKEAMEKALEEWCPGVPAVADADIRTSFDDSSVLTDQEIEEMLNA